MKGSILAHLRRVSTSPEGRALIHAVDDAGLEYKIEVPVEALRGVSPDQGHVLVLSWSLQAVSLAAEPATEPTPAEPPLTATTRSSTPSAVDQAFMELMGHGSRSAVDSSPETSNTPVSTTNRTSQGLAELLGGRRA